MAARASEAESLRKRYGSVEALAGIDLAVETGTVFGLLGPNGAGKTTAVRILTTLLPPTPAPRVDGIDVLAEPAKLRTRIGVAGQYAAVDENMTGFENLEMVGRLYHLGPPTARRRATELLEAFDLADAGDRSSRRTPAGCVDGSTSGESWSRDGRCSSSTSRRRASTREAGSGSGSIKRRVGGRIVKP